VSKKVPVQVVVAAFREEGAAQEVADALKSAKYRYGVRYKNVAVVRKNEEGKVKIKETGDMGGGVGATIGAVVGGALGIFAGPPGLVAGAAAGAAIGGAGAALHDAGIPDDRLEQIGDVLGNGNSAVIAIFEEVKVDKATYKEIDKSAAETVENLATNIGETLAGGQDVAYMWAITDDGVVAERMAVGEEASDVEAFVITEEGAAIVAAEATEEDVAYEAAVAAEDAVVYETGVATEEGGAVVDVVAVPEESEALAEESSDEEDSADSEEKSDN
jgi:uncharacterized membrane protein